MSNQSLLHYSFNTTTDDDATYCTCRVTYSYRARGGRYDKVPCLKNTELHASMVARKLQY
jgi:hypothetical protein